MATDHVTLNVGGRLFHTTRGTLEFSKAGFFEALLARWNDPQQTIAPEACQTQDDPPLDTSDEEPSKKRRRSEGQIAPFVLVDSEAPGEPTVAICSSGSNDRMSNNALSSPIFIDRDPESFEDVLYFMRCQQIKPATCLDICRLKQLQIEALFYGYNILSQACESALQMLVESQKPEKEVAYSDTVILGNRGAVNRPRKEIKVPAGHVLYVDFVSVWGLETLDENRRVNLGFYRRSSERLPPGQRQVRSITILCSSKKNTESPFANRIGICISPKDKNNKIGLICAPLVTGILWQVHYWIGPPNKIPHFAAAAQPFTHQNELSLEPSVALRVLQGNSGQPGSAN